MSGNCWGESLTADPRVPARVSWRYTTRPGTRSNSATKATRIASTTGPDRGSPASAFRNPSSSTPCQDEGDDKEVGQHAEDVKRHFVAISQAQVVRRLTSPISRRSA